MKPNKRVLFVPVSGPDGIGEYMRSLILADALQVQYPGIAIDFILSKQAPYFKECPYPVHTTSASPTQSTAQVIEIINQLKPNIVVFDCSGRAKQYRAAKACGAKVIFISQHKKKRKRAFALNRIRNIDWHAIVQFEFVDGGITAAERIKLALFRKPAPDFIGAVFSQATADSTFHFNPPFTIFAAGGGGHRIHGELATDILWQAARIWHKQSGQQCYVILGPNYPAQQHAQDGVVPIRQLPNGELMHLLSCCQLAVIAGGDMMGQGATLGVPIVAVPVAKDQPPRIAAFAREGLVVAAEPNTSSILSAIERVKAPQRGQFRNGADLFVAKVSAWLSDELPAQAGN